MTLAFFFARECTFDAARVYYHPKVGSDLPDERSGRCGGIVLASLFDEGHDLGGQFVRALGSALARQ